MNIPTFVPKLKSAEKDHACGSDGIKGQGRRLFLVKEIGHWTPSPSPCVSRKPSDRWVACKDLTYTSSKLLRCWLATFQSLSLGSGTPRRALWFFNAAAATASSFQIRRLKQLQTKRCGEAVNFFDVELAHEVDRFLIDHLTGNHDRKPGRVGNHKVCRDQIGTLLEAPINFRTRELHMLTLILAICSEESRAHVPLTR